MKITAEKKSNLCGYFMIWAKCMQVNSKITTGMLEHENTHMSVGTAYKFINTYGMRRLREQRTDDLKKKKNQHV